jgi:multidrug efflux pump subunit AcrB
VNIGEYSVRTPVIGWLLVVILSAGGIWGFQAMGKLEDPAFTIKHGKDPDPLSRGVRARGL